jgi:meiotically up-regulated gene 157 (Mug157) protein
MTEFTRDYKFENTISADLVFPGLLERLSTQRADRVTKIVERFFSKTLKATATGAPFVITGDIPAMWLRDSTWQVSAFLKSPNKEIGEILADISISQQRFFLIDPYANAFNPEPNGFCWHKDFPDQSPWVFERKYELDSLASVLYLARKIRENWGIERHLLDEFQTVVETMVALAQREQRHDPQSYFFHRNNGVDHDSLPGDGFGNPVEYTGMIYSAFRPSDDACVYGYLIPANYFFLNELKQLPQTTEISTLVRDISQGIQNFGTVDGKLAYEVDGLGNYLLIDDANTPSLLSLSYLGVIEHDNPIYVKTREFVLSESNPYFFSGLIASGIGSQHTPKNHIWPIAIAMEALSKSNVAELDQYLLLLESTDNGTSFMHESFHMDDPSIFTRDWFSWADATYLELVVKSVEYGY